jgi:methylmalonyl-CoA mutase cobalamin-binding subunit
METATSPLAEPHVVVAPASREHELDALLSAAAAAAEGWRVTYLGPSLPVEDIAEVAAFTRAHAVVLSGLRSSGAAREAEELDRLAALLPGNVRLVAAAAPAADQRALRDGRAALRSDLAGLRSELRALARHREDS